MSTYQRLEALRQSVIDREASRPGLRGRINAKCAECIYDPAAGNGTWLEQVAGCTAPDCPLWPVRPVPKGRKDTGKGVLPAELAPDGSDPIPTPTPASTNAV
jgi:hypothetical protein